MGVCVSNHSVAEGCLHEIEYMDNGVYLSFSPEIPDPIILRYDQMSPENLRSFRMLEKEIQGLYRKAKQIAEAISENKVIPSSKCVSLRIKQ